MTDAPYTSTVIQEGFWLYDGSVPTPVRIVSQPFWFGSGDNEDPEEIREDRPIPCFAIEWGASGQHEFRAVTRTINFLTPEEAATHVEVSAPGVVWKAWPIVGQQ
jgi:hypothetical protein